MAEGWARHLKGGLIEPYSAGVKATTLDPRAVAVMEEAGVDISDQRSKTVEEIMHIKFDYVFTLCGHAQETCPIFPAKARVIHRGLDDPPRLAESAMNEEKAMEHYRRVRDEVRAFIERLPDALDALSTKEET